jgi:transposase
MERKKAYPSDISRRQFEPIGPLPESALPESVRKRTKPRTVDLHQVFNAVLYLLDSGCRWRMLAQGVSQPVDGVFVFAKWSRPGPDGGSALERA